MAKKNIPLAKVLAKDFCDPGPALIVSHIMKKMNVIPYQFQCYEQVAQLNGYQSIKLLG